MKLNVNKKPINATEKHLPLQKAGHHLTVVLFFLRYRSGWLLWCLTLKDRIHYKL